MTGRGELARAARTGLAALAVAALALAGAAGLAACGKKGDLKPPPGEESDYPREYPRE